MKNNKQNKTIFLYCIIFLLLATIPSLSYANSKQLNSITGYFGIGTNAKIEEIPTFSFDLEKAYYAGLTYNREFFRTEKIFNLSLEAEVGIYDHFGKFGNHQEATTTILARLNNLFPKDFFIESFAFGEGLSLASKKPNFEAHLHTDNKSSDFLNYLAFEFVFKIPHQKDTKLIYRLHHRSGAYGLFNNIHGGSNYLSFGLRHNF